MGSPTLEAVSTNRRRHPPAIVDNSQMVRFSTSGPVGRLIQGFTYTVTAPDTAGRNV